MGQCLREYDPELLETAIVVLRSMPHIRPRAATVYGAMIRAYAYQSPPALHDFLEDLCRVYSASGATKARKQETFTPRQFLKSRLVVLVQRALDDRTMRMPEDARNG